MTVWRYYLKMIRYEQFLVPGAMMGIFLLLIVLMKATAASDTPSKIALGFIEAALPLATAIVANSLFLEDPALELQYTVSRPLWRTLLEKGALLIGIMTLFYGLFTVVAYALGAPLIGWAVLPSGALAWIAPALAWLGVAFLAGALLTNGVAGNALAALVWMICFLVHDYFLSTPNWRAVYPFMTIFEPNSPDWLLNRAGLVLVGVVGVCAALILLRKGERYFRTQA